MCFVLYAGTTTALPRKSFDRSAPNLSVESLCDRNFAIRQHFSNPEVQYIGSTSGCGCDFPHVIRQNGEWPIFEPPEKDEVAIAQDISDRQNLEALVNLLRTSREKIVELYGLWDGDFTKPPDIHEDISVHRLLESGFHFKEGGFYKVHLDL